jgi:hypothetical protein
MYELLITTSLNIDKNAMDPNVTETNKMLTKYTNVILVLPSKI